MPKVIVNDRHEGYIPRVLDGAGNWQTTPPELVTPNAFVELGWSKDAEHVQLATREGGDIDEAEDNPRHGWYVQLDRAGINRLIRALRDARDQAFGKDA